MPTAIRKRIITRRWCHVLFLSTVMAVMMVLGFVLFSERIRHVAVYVQTWPPGLLAATGIMVTAGLTTLLIRLGAIGPRFKVSTVLKYPPVWVAFVMGTGLALVYLYYTGHPLLPGLLELGRFILLAGMVVVVGVLIAFGFGDKRVIYSPAPTSPQGAGCTLGSTHGRGVTMLSDEHLVEWVLDESPIHTPDEDLFGHATMAKRTAQYIVGPTARSVGLSGPYGSGKSSVIRMVKGYIDDPALFDEPEEAFNGKIIHCDVDGWARDDNSVSQHMLSLAIDRVKQHIDASSIIALPARYHAALNAAPSVLGTVVAALLGKQINVSDQLAHLDNLLTVINARLVFFIEDLDRNLSDEVLGVELPGLLDRLRKTQNITFVVAMGTERFGLDVMLRICDRVEAIG